MPVYVEGLAELNRTLKRVVPDIYKDMHGEMRVIAGIVAETARSIAEREGLRDSGELIRRIQPGATMKTAVVRESAARKSQKYPEGFRYPAVYEFGHGRGRAFLLPAVHEREGEIERLLEEMVERVIARNALT